jgi:hypothetical protein
MAGIPMYDEIPTFGSVEAKMAREKLDVIKTENEQIKLDALKNRTEWFKKNMPGDTSGATQAPANYPGQVNTEAMPVDEPKKVLATAMDGNQTQMPPGAISAAPTTQASNGTPMPSFMTGTATEQRAKEPTIDETKPKPQGYIEPTQATVEGQPQVQADGKPAATTVVVQPPATTETKQEPPPTIIQQLKSTGAQVQKDKQELDYAYKYAEAMRKSGDLLSWQDAIKTANEMKTTVLDNEIKNLKVQDTFVEMTANHANGFLKAVSADPYNQALSDKAWNTMRLSLETAQIPTDSLGLIRDTKQRIQLAEQYRERAVSSKDQIKLQITDKNNEIKLEGIKQKATADQNLDTYKYTALAQQKEIAAGKLSFKELELRQNTLKGLAQVYEKATNNVLLSDEVRADAQAKFTYVGKELNGINSALKNVKPSVATATPGNAAAPAASTTTTTTTEKAPANVGDINTERTQAQNIINKWQSSDKPDSEKQAAIEGIKQEFSKRHNGETLDSTTSSAAPANDKATTEQAKKEIKQEILKEIETLKKQQGSKALLFGKPINEVADSIKSWNQQQLKEMDNPTIFGQKIQSTESAREERIAKLLKRLEDLDKVQ